MGNRSRSRSKKRERKSRSSDDESGTRSQSSRSLAKKKRKDKVSKDKKEKSSKRHGRKSSSRSHSKATRDESESNRKHKEKKKLSKRKDKKAIDKSRDEEKEDAGKADHEKKKEKVAKDKGHAKDRQRSKGEDAKKDKKDKRTEEDKNKKPSKDKGKDKDREKGKKNHEKRRSSSQSSRGKKGKRSRDRKRSRSRSKSRDTSEGGLKNARKRAAKGWDAQSSGEVASQVIVAQPVPAAAPVPTPPGGFRIQSFEEILQQLRTQGASGSSTAQAVPAPALALVARPLSEATGRDYGRRDDMFPEPNPEILSRANAQAKKEEEDGRLLIRKTGQVPIGPPGLPTGVLVINQKFVDFLIGPSGQSLAAINYAAGVSIVLDQSHMWEGYTIARIYGAEANCDRAKIAIEFKTKQWVPRTGSVRKAGPTGGPVGYSGWQHPTSESANVGRGLVRTASTSVAL